MFSLYRVFALILSTLMILSLFNQGAALPVDDWAPNHAGPEQIGTQHLGPSRDHHAGPPGGQGQGQVGSVAPGDIVYY